MALWRQTRGSRLVALLGTFTAMLAVLDALPMVPGFYAGVWDSWVFVLSPLVGILMGPLLGAVSVLLGSLIGHLVVFRDVFELFFMLGAAVGCAMAGFVFQTRWRPALATYTVLLMLYLLYPVSWALPLWGVWDILVGYCTLVFFSLMVIRDALPEEGIRRNTTLLILSSLIGLESDALFRVVLLVPGQTYWLFYGLNPTQLQLLWIAAGIVTPIKVALGTALVVILGLALLRGLRTGHLELPS
jgi:hypothetical protein